jgi:hypothetical protein
MIRASTFLVIVSILVATGSASAEDQVIRFRSGTSKEISISLRHYQGGDAAVTKCAPGESVGFALNSKGPFNIKLLYDGRVFLRKFVLLTSIREEMTNDTAMISTVSTIADSVDSKTGRYVNRVEFLNLGFPADVPEGNLNLLIGRSYAYEFDDDETKPPAPPSVGFATLGIAAQ